MVGRGLVLQGRERGRGGMNPRGLGEVRVYLIPQYPLLDQVVGGTVE